MMIFAIMMVFFMAALIALVIPLTVGVLVYRDADKRVDCNPVLWALIAALAPSFVGLIIYLIIRNDYPMKNEMPHYDEFGNPIPVKTPTFPKWAKVLLIVLAVLFLISCMGGCVAGLYSMLSYDHTNMDHLFYTF